MSRRRDQTQAGSAAVEAAIGVPVFLLLVSLAFLGGRLAVAHQAVQSAASEGARLASLARTAPEARAAAAAGAHATLAGHAIACSTSRVTVDTGGFAVAVGLPAAVEVTVSCAVPLAHFGFPGTTGARVVTATMSSALDTYRGR